MKKKQIATQSAKSKIIKKSTGTSFKTKVQSKKIKFPKNWGKVNGVDFNDEGVPSKNNELLMDFSFYCISNPRERFFQALRNWSGMPFVLTATGYDFDKGVYTGIQDTFYDNKITKK